MLTMKSKRKNYNLRCACHKEGLLCFKEVGSSLTTYIDSLIVLGRQILLFGQNRQFLNTCHQRYIADQDVTERFSRQAFNTTKMTSSVQLVNKLFLLA